jgi:WD40-like Beta Propeller Repeat
MSALVRVLTVVLLGTGLAVHESAARQGLPAIKPIYPLSPGEGVFAYSRISPNGRLLVYASETKPASGGLGFDRTVTVVDLEARKVLFAELGVDAYWSTDGDRMIFLSEKDGLARVSIRHLDGAIVREVAPVHLGGYFSWGRRDGRDLILTILGNLYYVDGNRAVLPEARVPSCDGIGAGERPLLSKDGRRVSTFVRGTVVVRNLSDCSAILDTGVAGAKADFSWDGRYIAFHAPKKDATGYEILVVDLVGRTIRTITNLPGSSFFPSWTQDGRLAFRYDGADYRGFMMASDVFSAPERPLAGQPNQRVPDRIAWSDVFPDTPAPTARLAVVTVWGTWSAHSAAALVDLQRVSREFADDRVSFGTATDFGSRYADITRMRARYGITLRQIPLAPAALRLTEAHNQIPVTMVFRDNILAERRLGAQTYDALRSWITDVSSRPFSRAPAQSQPAR